MPTPDVVTDSTAIADLQAAFRALAGQPLGTADLRHLRPLVCAVVDEMMRDGTFPERILIALRRLAVDSGLDWDNEHLSEPVLRWCLWQYYRTN